jgi:hypothetical protein
VGAFRGWQAQRVWERGWPKQPRRDMIIRILSHGSSKSTNRLVIANKTCLNAWVSIHICTRQRLRWQQLPQRQPFN